MRNLDKPFKIMSESDSLAGFSRSRREVRNPAIRNKIAAAAQLWWDVRNGTAPVYFIQEAIRPSNVQAARMVHRQYPVFTFREGLATSDFPILTGDVLNRMLLAQYAEWDMPYRNYVNIDTQLIDFRKKRLIAFDDAEGVFQEQEQGEELKYRSPNENDYEMEPKKYSAAVQIHFETIINDDLDAFMRIPEKLARGARRTPAKFATTLYCDNNGPEAGFYNVGNNNLITDQLNIAGLQNGIRLLSEQKDDDGEPIHFEVIHLVVPPALEVTANNLMNMISFDATDVASGGDTGNRIRISNWLASRMRLWVDPYIPIVAFDARAAGRQPWFLFGDPNIGRPAIAMGFLRGYSEPVLYQKLANTIRVGGGVDQFAGDFETMSQTYKALIAFGGTQVDPKTTVASDATA